MGGIRNKVRPPSSVLGTQAIGNPCSEGAEEPSTKIETSRTKSLGFQNMICLQRQTFSRANSLNSCDAIPCLSKQAAATKVSAMNSRLGRASSALFEKTLEILDTVGSSMTNLNNSSGFNTWGTTKENKVSILAFEVGNTIKKGAKLMESLSEHSIEHLKSTRLQSKGLRMLVTEDIDELLTIAGADKREELEKFSKEVVRLGNHCKDPQWHNLDGYLKNLAAELTKTERLNAESTMKQLMTLVNHTAELFKALQVLDKVEQDYAEKLKGDSTNVAQRGNIAILEAELQAERKHVINLKKKSLWSKNFEEVISSLVEIVHFLHLKIHDAFGSADCYKLSEASRINNNRLGPAGIALNYAHIISQIDTLASLTSSIPANVRDDLYQRLPHNMKSALATNLKSFQAKHEMVLQHIPLIRSQIEITLQWIVPIARNTTNYLQGFGWVREWENSGSEVYQKSAGRADILRIETLYHADKEKTEACIFRLLVWLQHLTILESTYNEASSSFSKLTSKDQEMLEDVEKKISSPGKSKSQYFDVSKTKLRMHQRLTKSSRESPTSENDNCLAGKWMSCTPFIDFDISRIKALDIIDGIGRA